jgi:hypothetical protein
VNDDIDGDLTAQQRADLRFGEWIAQQRRMHRIDKFLCLITGLALGAALSRFFS